MYICVDLYSVVKTRPRPDSERSPRASTTSRVPVLELSRRAPTSEPLALRYDL